MKKTRLISLTIFILVSLNSCKDNNPRVNIDGIRRILNETDHQLEIVIYGDIGDTLKYSIVPNSFIEIKGKCYEGAGALERCIIDWDSLPYGTITFDNERIQQFELDSPLGCGGKAINGSVWKNCGYKLVENTETLQVFEYKVTDTDYHNADIL
jgi:hypothetical protein